MRRLLLIKIQQPSTAFAWNKVAHAHLIPKLRTEKKKEKS